MAENKLEIILSAKTAGIEKSLADVEQRVRRTAKGIGQAFVNSAGEVAELGNALDGVEFQKVATEAKAAAATVTKSFDKAGADLKQAFAASGGEIPASMARAKAAVADFASTAKSDLAKVGAAGQDTADKLDSIGNAVDSINLANLADAAVELAEGFRDAAEAARDALSEAGDGLLAYESRVKAAFEDTSSQEKVIKAGRDIKDVYGKAFELDSIGEGAQAFKRFGADADEAALGIKRAAAVAKAESKDFGGVADILAEAFSKDAFDAGVFEQIRGELGIGGQALKAYGAAVDDTGKVLADTKAQQEAAQKALAAYIDTNSRYAGAADRTKTAYSQAQTEVEKFKNQAAEGFNELREGLAEVALPFLKVLNSFPEGFTTAAAGFALITPAVVGFAIGLGKVITISRRAAGLVGGGKPGSGGGEGRTSQDGTPAGPPPNAEFRADSLPGATRAVSGAIRRAGAARVIPVYFPRSAVYFETPKYTPKFTRKMAWILGFRVWCT